MSSLSYFSPMKYIFSTASLKVDSRTFYEKVTEAIQDDFVYLDEASEYPNIDRSNDNLLQSPTGQLINAKVEFINGLGHAVYAAGNVILAGSHGVTMAANLHNAFVVVTNVGGLVNEVKTTLGAGVAAEDLLRKGKDAYDRFKGNPVEAHKPTKLDQAYDFVKQADNIFHENTGYLALGLNTIKTSLYPENFVGFFSNSGKAVVNAYQAVKCEVNAVTAIAKAGYYAAKNKLNEALDNSSKDLSEDIELDNFAALDDNNNTTLNYHENEVMDLTGTGMVEVSL